MSRAHTTGVLVCVATLMVAGMVYFGRLTIYTTDILGKPGLETLLPSLFADWYVDDRLAIIASSPDNQIAQDFQISSNTCEIITLTGREVAAKQLMSQHDVRMEPITHRFLVGDQVTASRTEQKLTQFRLELKGIIPNGMLIRTSGIDCGHKLQQVSLSEMTLAIPEGDRNRVLGAPGGARLL
jgi:hypothetical protein